MNLIDESSIGDGGTSAVLDGANSLPIVLFKKWGKSLGIKMEFFETALVLDGANSLPIVLFKKWGKSLGIKMEFFETALVLD